MKYFEGDPKYPLVIETEVKNLRERKLMNKVKWRRTERDWSEIKLMGRGRRQMGF